MAPFTFTREQSTVLITLYEQHPNLYCLDSPLYKNKAKRLASLQKIVDDFNGRFALVNISVDDVKKKINSLRTQYLSELNKVKKSLVSGAGTNDIYIPTLWCYNQLQFLSETVVVRPSTSNFQSSGVREEMPQEECETLFEGTLEELAEAEDLPEIGSPLSSPPLTRPSSSIEIEPPLKRKKVTQRTQVEQKATDLLEKASHLLQTCPTEHHQDPLDVFGELISTEMKQIKNQDIVLQLKRKIMTMVYDAIERDRNSDK